MDPTSPSEQSESVKVKAATIPQCVSERTKARARTGNLSPASRLDMSPVCWVSIGWRGWRPHPVRPATRTIPHSYALRDSRTHRFGVALEKTEDFVVTEASYHCVWRVSRCTYKHTNLRHTQCRT